jgi:uncharacterized protein (DUF2126 family)
MTIRVAINHRTEYLFDRAVAVAPHLVRLRPAPHTRTPVHRYSLKAEPAEHFVNWQQDPFGNYVARYVFPEKTRRLAFEVELVADMTVVNPFDFFLEAHAEQFPFRYEPQLARDLRPYLEVGDDGALLREWLSAVDTRNARATVDFLVDLNARIQRDVDYSVRMEAGVQTCEQTLERGIGSCRDSGWLLVQVFRHLGLAARFVSGYLVQLTADQASLDGPSGPEADFTDLHAWAEVYLPGAGWVGLDPTSGLFAGEGHIPLACTPDPTSAAPVTGATEPCEVNFRFHNRVARVHEDPRVTRPLADADWERVLALGDALDVRLQAGDVRLTMGGEPTFVSIDDMDGAEWTVAALGESKRALAGALVRRLHARFAAGGVLHYGQGKWYPGEPLPRWTLSCLWRRDGVPMWGDPARLASPGERRAHDAGDARRFAEALASVLQLAPSSLMPAYEDVYYSLWQEGTLPVGEDPLSADLGDGLERRRLAAQLESGLGEVRGYVMPLAYDEERAGGSPWRSGRWRLRRERLYLLPGDSPMGLRLPLASLEPDRSEERHEPDPFARRPALAQRYGPGSWSAAKPGARQRVAEHTTVRTALCVELRDGQIHVFMPPLLRLEHYLDLLAAVEQVAGSEDLSVVLEGYEPPGDTRLAKLQVTPDPGVIEVNVQPAASWRELVSNTEILYEEARQSRLGTEKFMLDGRHTGTGGGNHVTIGAARPEDSPALRRPDLLASLVTYWQHHPSLSYLFSGAFIGPTSQSPRVDEARHESLYELEIALQQLAGAGDSAPPWLVDRALRHLLVDLTGNTHRAEFCIDKLYSPDGVTGRLGLVELRGFEMPPHSRMALLQVLLLRALVARFWDDPYRARPVRWGTALHDRFMLPHFVWQDFIRVIEETRDAGIALERQWFDSFLEFRFPHYGAVVVDEVELSLRWAIEPWHVLGEEVSAGGTARYVDSSVERLQVTLRGAVPGQHALACNGTRVALTPTGTHGEFVAGIRYKAWQPPSGLHPAIGVHAPLVFDLVDLPNAKALGGCTYHVSHPGGRNYDTFPVNANEAEARRVARFWSHGHTPGPIDLGPEERNPEYPCTLDLRYRAS